MTKPLSLFFTLFFLSQMFSQNVSGALRTARLMERRGDTENAIAIYENILDKNHNQQAYTNLKKLYSRLGAYDEMATIIHVYKTRFPKKLEAALDLGEAYWKLDDKEAAKREWTEAENNFGSHTTIYKKFFYLFTNLGLSEEVHSMINRARLKFNDPALLSMDIANYHYSRKSFKTAIVEYLNYLSAHPVQIKMITDRILLISDDEDSHNIIVDILNENIKKNSNLYRPVLAGFFFKTQQYNKAFNQHLVLGFNSDKDVSRWMNFSNGLRKESQFEIAVKTYETLLSQNRVTSSPIFAGQALLGLGQTFEDKIIPHDSKNLSFISFFKGNLFFKDPFYHQQNISVQSLDIAFQLYDSLLTSMPSSSFSAAAYHRLGEIQFKLLNDFDGALKSYQHALNSRPKTTLKNKIKLRIGEMHLAKGNLEKAQHYFNQTKKTKGEFHYYYILTQLFLGQIDTSLTLIEASLENITPISSDFNDLMELRNFISHHYQNGMELDKHAFKLFLNGEYYLRQKKLPEAVASFTYIQEQYSESSLADVAVFREALIRLKLNQISEAVALAEKLTETKFADRGWVLLGEIYEIFNTNPEAALTYYYRLLEDFPTSYLTEPVRLHVRNLKDQLKS